MATGVELTYDTGATATEMANAIFGDGVTVVSASYTGWSRSSAVYSNGQLAPGVVPSDTGVILSTGDVRSFTQSSGDPNRSSSTTTDTSGPNNNSLFNDIAGTNTYDAAWLEVSFIPTADTMTMQFVFASEEYPEYLNSQFNDVVGVWINGVQVPITVGTGDTSVNNLGPDTAQNLYVDNTTDAYNTEMDGFTVTLTLTIPVVPGEVNTIRIGIADVGDAQYDSNLLIAAGSAQTALVARDDAVTVNPTGQRTLDALANDSGPTGATLVITHINGIPVVAGQTVALPSGQQVTLNADGTFTVAGDGGQDLNVFTYTVADGLGHTATGLVTLTSVPCFVAGTRIATPQGQVPVQALIPGDLVLTRDEGPRPLRWIGRRQVPAEGDLAPIHIRAGTFGDHGDLMVSPQHRILIAGARAELLFGEPEVLVAARDLVDGRRITRRQGGMVEYVHLLFDRHQVVLSEGLPSESFLPGPQIPRMFDRPVIEEICRLFPELDPATGQGYGPAARRLLRSHEARVLVGVAA